MIPRTAFKFNPLDFRKWFALNNEHSPAKHPLKSRIPSQLIGSNLKHISNQRKNSQIALAESRCGLRELNIPVLSMPPLYPPACSCHRITSCSFLVPAVTQDLVVIPVYHFTTAGLPNMEFRRPREQCTSVCNTEAVIWGPSTRP